MKIDVNKLYLKMIESGMTLKKISKLAKLSTRTITRVLGGGTPHFLTVHKIANALNITPSEILMKDE